MRRTWRAANIFWTASIPTGARLTVLPGRCGSRFSAAIFALRTAALNRIEQLYAGNPYAIGMMEATLIGETGNWKASGPTIFGAPALTTCW